jgi:eukaryotic-like serine/threonine-protein kinase
MNTQPDPIQLSVTQPIGGRYVLQERLPGDPGAPVELYRAQDSQLQRQVTVQILSPDAPDGFAEHFRDNSRVAATIHHCGMVEVYDLGEWQGRPYTILENGAAAEPHDLFPEDDQHADTERALRLTREAAEALQCVRDAGLAGWAFNSRALRLGADGSARLALLGGLDMVGGQDDVTSTSPQDDPKALRGLLLALLTGSAATRLYAPSPAISAPVAALLERTEPGRSDSFTSAGDMARAITELEEAAAQRTQAYLPASDAPASTMAMAPAYDSHEAPTMAAAPAAAAAWAAQPVTAPAPAVSPQQTAQLDARPYTPPEGAAVAAEHSRRRVSVPLVAAVVGLLLFGLLAALLWPRQTGLASDSASRAPGAAPSEATVPELRGKSLDDARSAAGASGLNLAVADPVYDGAAPPDSVARQQPDAGARVQPSSLITVSLSLGPEPVPADTPAPAPSQVEGQQPPPAPQAEPDKKEPPGQEKKKDKKDKDK